MRARRTATRQAGLALAFRGWSPVGPGRVGAAPPGAIRNGAPRGGPREGPLAVHGTPQQLFLPGYNAVEKDSIAFLQPSCHLGYVHVRGAKFLEGPLHCLFRLGRVPTGEDV